MFALMQLEHGDFGPLFASRDEALDSLRLIHEQLPQEADEYGVVELDQEGFPLGEPITEAAAVRPQLA